MFSISYQPYQLNKKHRFRIAGGARKSTPLILVKLNYLNYTGYGEASMPPLYGESIASAIKFLKKIELSKFKDPFDLEAILKYIDGLDSGNPAIKASIDIAFHDLIGKILEMPVHDYFGLPAKDLVTSKTIGINSAKTTMKRVDDAEDFKVLKIKLGSINDKEVITRVRDQTQKPLYVDANQAWRDKYFALDRIYWLREQNIRLVEQPMPKDAFNDLEWLAGESPLPIIGDEGIQRLADLSTANNFYHGINIKLMKSTGLHEAYKMAVTAKSKGLKIMLGCMSETSCAIAAACQLGVLADWVDLDGNLSVTNDPYVGHCVKHGIIKLNNEPGIGLINPQWPN